MKLEDFAETYRLVLKRDECGDYFVPGRGVIVMPPSDRATVWPYARRRLTAAGCAIIQTETWRVVHFLTPKMLDRANLL